MMSSRHRCQLPAWDLHIDTTVNVIIYTFSTLPIVLCIFVSTTCAVYHTYARTYADGETGTFGSFVFFIKLSISKQYRWRMTLYTRHYI